MKPAKTNGKTNDTGPRDTRPRAKPSEVATAILAGADAVAQALKDKDNRPPRFVGGESWGPLRQAFHVLPDDERREAIVRLLVEEAGRVANDSAASWSGSRRRPASADADAPSTGER